MPSIEYQIYVDGITVHVLRKAIKNMYFRIYPPDGQVRLSVPLAMDEKAIRNSIISRQNWIKSHQAKFVMQPKQSRLQMATGENHYFLGDCYRLQVIAYEGKPHVTIRKGGNLDLFIQPNADASKRMFILQEWYRKELKKLVPKFIDKWQPVMNVQVNDWGVRRMKTRWGSCNINAGRISLNLELIKKPIQCLEYIVVHEMVHLLERLHNDRFIKYMDLFLPQWKQYRDLLNRASSEFAY